MVKESILGGLKSALSRGESINQAMRTFYNAGYKKEDIEDAARALQNQQPQQIKQQQEPTQTKPIKPKQKIVQGVSNYGQEKFPTQFTKKTNIQEGIQKVSNYEQKSKGFGGKIITFILIFILLFLLGILAAVFFFKEELVEFFNNLFG